MDPIEMGLRFNSNTQILDYSDWFDNGRYFLGIGQYFIRFPRTYQVIRLGSTFKGEKTGGDVVVRSYDGLPLNVEFSFTYKLPENAERLSRLYLDLNENKELLIANIAGETARDVASQFLAFDIFSSRDAFIEDMTKELRMRLGNSTLGITVPSFELVNFEVASEFSNAIEDTQVSRQDVIQARFERDVAEVDARRERDVAIELATVKVLAANYTAQRIINEEQAASDALLYTVKKQALAAKAIKEKLGFNSNEDLLKYLTLAAIQESKSESVTLQQNIPAVFQTA